MYYMYVLCGIKYELTRVLVSFVCSGAAAVDGRHAPHPTHPFVCICANTYFI